MRSSRKAPVSLSISYLFLEPFSISITAKKSSGLTRDGDMPCHIFINISSSIYVCPLFSILNLTYLFKILTAKQLFTILIILVNLRKYNEYHKLIHINWTDIHILLYFFYQNKGCNLHANFIWPRWQFQQLQET